MDLDVEEASSGSEVELCDIDFSYNEPAFPYVDYLTVSPLFSAVIKGDVESIKNLLKSGQSVNNNDNLGNTPLHVSVITQCKASFDFLITVEDIRLDAQNFKGETPLISATKSSNKDREYFALNLIESGANTEVVDFDKHAPLHYASTDSFEVTKKLIDSGANVNVFNDLSGTPLMSAILSHQTEIVYLLAFGGTDMELVREDKNTAFTLSLLLPDRNLQEFLFDCSFDRHYKQSVALNVFNKVLLSSGDSHEMFLNYFYECTSDFIYDEKDIAHLRNISAIIAFEDFKAFFTNFPQIFKVLFSYSPNFLFDFFVSRCYRDANEKSFRVVDYLNLIFSSEFVEDFIKCSRDLGNIICKLVRISKLNNHSLETLTELVKLMLSYGIEVTLYDLNSVYENYGVKCELFQFLLLMPIDLSYSDFLCGNINFLCLLMVDLNLSLEKSFNEIHLYYFSLRYSLGTILDYFAGEQLKVFTLMYHKDKDILDKPPQKIQSLRELSREASRKCLIEKFNIRNSMQFYSCLRKLPVNQVYKDIISYQRGIYY